MSAERIDWLMVAKIHIGILEAIHLWVSEFFVDFYCDQSLSEYFITFVAIANKELALWKDKRNESEEWRKAAEDIDKLWTDLKKLFSKQMYTPFIHTPPPITKPPAELVLPSPASIPELEALVDQLESAVSRSFNAVKLVDWILAFEILETQSAEPLGFFVPKMALLSNEEEMNFQDIFFLLENLRRVNSNDTVFDTLPAPLQGLCILHRRLGDWVLAQITESNIKFETRGKRISALLKCLTICRSRMSGLDLYQSSNSGPRQHIPSFVESAIAAALVRPESRIFAAAWGFAVEYNGGSGALVETLEQVIPKSVGLLSNNLPMTPCVGWLIERMLEIVCYVPNMLVENNRLINFDKRRYVYNLINNFTNSCGYAALEGEPQVDGEEEICLPANFDSDRRLLRDISNRENQTHRNGKLKVFWKLSYQEQEKLRRDSKQRETIERQQRDQVRALHRRQPTLAPESSKKGGKRLGVNTLFKAVRPISMALTNSWTPPTTTGRIVSPHDLPLAKGMVHSRKPTATIDLLGVTGVSAPKSTRDRFMWKIRTDGGTGYLMQAPSEAEMDDWLKVIASIRGVAATDGAESIDGLTVVSQPRVALPGKNQSPSAEYITDIPIVFGIPLEELCKRDNVKVPVVVEALLAEIELRGK